jgi:hypothetical protein
MPRVQPSGQVSIGCCIGSSYSYFRRGCCELLPIGPPVSPAVLSTADRQHSQAAARQMWPILLHSLPLGHNVVSCFGSGFRVGGPTSRLNQNPKSHLPTRKIGSKPAGRSRRRRLGPAPIAKGLSEQVRKPSRQGVCLAYSGHAAVHGVPTRSARARSIAADTGR